MVCSFTGVPRLGDIDGCARVPSILYDLDERAIDSELTVALGVATSRANDSPFIGGDPRGILCRRGVAGVGVNGEAVHSHTSCDDTLDALGETIEETWAPWGRSRKQYDVTRMTWQRVHPIPDGNIGLDIGRDIPVGSAAEGHIRLVAHDPHMDI